MRNVFPEAAVYAEDMFFVFTRFGDDCDCLLQFKQMEDCFGVFLHTARDHPLFEKYMAWLSWTFSV